MKVDLSVSGTGQQLEKSTVEYIHGGGMMLPGLEAVLEGLEKGGTRVELEIPSVTPDRAEARTYGKNALMWGGGAAVMWYYIVFPKPGLEFRVIGLPMAVMASAFCVREALAFLRSRRPPEVRP